jgi:hypothetical protein
MKVPSHTPQLPEEQPVTARPQEGSAVLLRETRATAIKTDTVLNNVKQTDGFKTADEFKIATIIGNEKVRQDFRQYQQQALDIMLHAHQPNEMPKFNILSQCADGRVAGPENFTKNPLTRFNDSWKPMAGIKMSMALEEVNNSDDPLTALTQLLSDPERKEKLFAELEQIFGRKLRYQLLVSQAAVMAGKKVILQEEYDQHIPQETRDLADKLIAMSAHSLQDGKKENLIREKMKKLQVDQIPVTIELQSHSTAALDDHHHGCGAHGSDTKKALQLTAINAFALEAYIKEQFPQDAQRIHIVRTHHITGREEEVLDANQGPVGDILSPDMREKLNGKFAPLFYKDATRGLVRVGKENHHGIDQEHHDEYIVRFSQHHKANGLENTSVLEQVMPPDIQLAEALALKLISIAQNNRIQKDKEKGIHQPIFLHLDAPAQEPSIQALYTALFRILTSNPHIQHMIRQGELYIIQSETRRLDIRDEESLKISFSA